MIFKPVIDTKFINGQQIWWRPMGSGQDPEQAEYFLFCGRKEDPRIRFLDGRVISADRGEWAPHGPEVITKDMLREVIAALVGLNTLIVEGQAILATYVETRSEFAGDAAVEAVAAIGHLIEHFDGTEQRAAQGEAQRLYEKYDESKAVSTVEGAPLTGKALEMEANKFMLQLTWAIYSDVDMKRTVKEIREEHEAVAPPEVIEYIRAEFTKEGINYDESNG